MSYCLSDRYCPICNDPSVPGPLELTLMKRIFLGSPATFSVATLNCSGACCAAVVKASDRVEAISSILFIVLNEKVEKLYVKAEVHDLSKVDLPTFGSPSAFK